MQRKTKAVVAVVALTAAGLAMCEIFSHDCTCDPGDPKGDSFVRTTLLSREGTVSTGDIVRIRDVRIDPATGSQYEVDYQWLGGEWEAVAERWPTLADGGGGGGSGDPTNPGGNSGGGYGGNGNTGGGGGTVIVGPVEPAPPPNPTSVGEPID